MKTSGITIDLARVAQITGGQVDGDKGFAVSNLSSLSNANSESLTFYANPRQRAKLMTTAAGAVMLRAQHAELFSGHKIIVADPYSAYARVSALFAPPPKTVGEIHPSAIIPDSARVHTQSSIGAYSVIGENVDIAEGVVIGSQVSVGDDCVLGSGTIIAPGVCIGDNTIIGARCRVHSGVVIAASGFGYADNQGEWLRIEQLGGVIIGDDVDIGANTTIDCGAIDNTVIGNGVKLDNHIQIAHNVQVGEHTIMASCVAIAGSTIIGKRCRFGGRVGILDNLVIVDDVTINASSVVAKSISEAGIYSSIIPVQPVALWRKTVAHLYSLNSIVKKIKATK